MKLILISILTIFFIFSCGSGGSDSFLDKIKKESKDISVFILKNASETTYTNLESIKKDSIIKIQNLSLNINCLDLDFTTISKEDNNSNRNYLKYTKEKRSCEIVDFKKSKDNNIFGDINKIFFLNNS